MIYQNFRKINKVVRSLIYSNVKFTTLQLQQQLLMHGSQLQELKKANQLPYIPIQFAYSQTIGAKKTGSHANSIYAHEYKDILTPRILNHHNPLFYLLFHTPTIYNWIRTIKTNESRLLDAYIRTNINTKDNGNKQNPLTLNILKSSLSDYVKKWEVIKLAYCHKVYVKRQLNEGQTCNHLCKTEVYVHEMEYIPKSKSFVYPRIMCKQCQETFQFQCQARQFSQYVFINNPTETTITVAKQKIAYNLYFTMNDQFVYIKCANKVWYQVNIVSKTIKPIGLPQINLRNMKYGAYSQSIKESSVIKIAEPLLLLEENKQVKQEIDIQVEQKVATQEAPIKNSQKQKKPQQKPKKSLKELKPKSNQVLLREPSQNYTDAVSRLYVQPKVKDEYELGYDKGKLKKKKQKKQYIKPDFNQIYQQIKANGPPISEPQKTKKIRKKSNKSKALQFGDDNDQ